MNNHSADVTDTVQDNDNDRNDRNDKMGKLWPQVRKLLVFQIKLYIDALRDLLLSALSLGAFLIDIVQRNEGPESYFEKVLKFGRRTERSIDLFNHYDVEHQDEHSVDSILNEVEEKIRENVKEGRK